MICHDGTAVSEMEAADIGFPETTVVISEDTESSSYAARAPLDAIY
jgi:hypothetical protein